MQPSPDQHDQQATSRLAHVAPQRRRRYDSTPGASRNLQHCVLPPEVLAPATCVLLARDRARLRSPTTPRRPRRRRRAPGRNMSRLVRALLGLPKPKGSDEREPDDDDPPYPDVTVVVIINKRSGSRLARPSGYEAS